MRILYIGTKAFHHFSQLSLKSLYKKNGDKIRKNIIKNKKILIKCCIDIIHLANGADRLNVLKFIRAIIIIKTIQNEKEIGLYSLMQDQIH